MQPIGRCFAILDDLATDGEAPLGQRLEAVRHIKAAAEHAERRLLMQLGVDLAKHLFAAGVSPLGLPIGDVLGAAATAIGATGSEDGR